MPTLNRLHDALLVLSIIALWIAVQLPPAAENVLGYFLILSVGVGHGANDVKIYFRDKKMSPLRSLAFISLYGFLVLLGFAAFFISPGVILVLFIVVSGFHFGQEHFEHYKLPQSLSNTLFFACYGIAIIVTLLYINQVESVPILADLIKKTVHATTLLYIACISFALSIALGAYILRKKSISKIIRELFYFVVLVTIFKVSSLVWGFAIYFILWHSVPSIHHQIEHLYGRVDRSSLWLYIKESLVYWVAALVFLGALYYALHDRTTLFLTVIVAFLGGITFPHVVVMHKIHKTDT